MITRKLFLASSSELQQDRVAFEIFINRKNKDWTARGVFLELIVWEDFFDAVSHARLQDEYNKAIRGCDIFVMLFFTKVGQYTEEEFETACGQFKATNKPFIFTYFKDAEISTGGANKKDLKSLWAFQEKLDALGHFYTVYKNIDELKLEFNSQLDKLAANGFVEFNPQKGQGAPATHQATLTGDGAIAQGSGAVAAGAGGVAVGGDNIGSINTGSQINTGGGAYVGGNVKVGGDFAGRDMNKTDVHRNVSLDDFRQHVAEFGQLLKQSGLSNDESEVIEGDFKAIETQTAKEKPNGAIVKSKLSGIMEVLKDTAGAAGHVDKILPLGGKLVKWAGVLFV